MGPTQQLQSNVCNGMKTKNLIGGSNHPPQWPPCFGCTSRAFTGAFEHLYFREVHGTTS